MSDIFQQLEIEAIPGMADFLDAPAPLVEEPAPGLASVPISQRVQALLTRIEGATWATAEVYSWTLPTGHQAHIAVGPNGIKMLGEQANGELALAVPLPHDNDEASEEKKTWTYANECGCMAEIFPALAKARSILKKLDTLTPDQRERLCDQIGHAAMHLEMNLDLWRKDEEEARQEGDVNT